MKTARMFDPFWFGWFAVLMLFVSARASAQVASVCGPGKSCRVRDLDATSYVEGERMCLQGSNARWTWTSSTSIGAWGWAPLASSCQTLAGNTNLLLFSINDNIVRSHATGGFSAGSGGFSAGFAFASFPTCNAGAGGRLLFDTTNNVWRYCDGAGTWQQLATAASLPTVPTVNEPTWSATSNFNAAAALEDINWLGPYTPNSGDVISKVDLTCNWATAGTGGTNGVVMAVYTAAGALQCKCSLMACTVAARVPGSCSCEAGLTPGTTYVMRLHGDTDCTANPQNIVCTAVLVP